MKNERSLTVKIVTWNCNGAFRKKFHFIDKFQADIYIIQECEDPMNVITNDSEYAIFTNNHLWVGNNKNKGLGVFIKTGLSIKKVDFLYQYNEIALQWFIPFIINNQRYIAV